MRFRFRFQTVSAGFTLIELLVVIAIISMLMGMLFPVYSRARDQGRQINCVANCKQLGLALQIYAQDYDDKIPYGYSSSDGLCWFNRLLSYVRNKQIYHCPCAGGMQQVVSYSVNSNLDGKMLTSGDPSSLIWLADGYETGTTIEVDGIMTDVSPSLAAYPDATVNDAGQVGYRHNDGAVFTFLDSHVKWQSRQVMKKDESQDLWKVK